MLLEKNAEEFCVENKKKAQILFSDPSAFSIAISHVACPSGSFLSVTETSKAKVFMAAMVLR